MCAVWALVEERRRALYRAGGNKLADKQIRLEENVAVSLLECAGREKSAVIEGWAACERGGLTKRWFASGWSGRVPVDLSDWKGWAQHHNGSAARTGGGVSRRPHIAHPGSAVGGQGHAS